MPAAPPVLPIASEAAGRPRQAAVGLERVVCGVRLRTHVRILPGYLNLTFAEAAQETQRRFGEQENLSRG